MNSFQSSALRCAAALACACVFGCGSDDGRRDFEQGSAAYEVRDLKKAEKSFEASLRRAPDDVDRLLMLARVRLDLGELASAKDLVGRAAESAGSDPDVVLLGAQIAWHAKDYKAAADGFTAISGNAGFDAALRAQGFAGLGIVEMTCNNHHLARIAFLNAIRHDRRNASARYHLGLLYRDGFDYKEAALEQFEIFVRLEASASPRVQKVQRAVIPALKESIARTLAERPGASRRDSAASATAIGKAEAAWKKGSYKVAHQCYQDALKADPLSYPAAMGLAKAVLRIDASKAGQLKALECYKTACTLRPSAVSTYLTTGALASRLGYQAQAVEIYSRAVAANPTSFEALDGLIVALNRVGRKANVARAYQAYRKSLPAKGRRS